MSLVGRTFGKYRLVERLGSGALADVYRGLQVGLERPVIVKVLPPVFAADASLRGRFTRSGLTTARLSHPNIVTIFDAGEDDGVPYTVMEELAAESLEDRIAERGALSWAETLRLALDVTKALGYAHGRGVAHGALEPGRVKFDSRHNALVADFARAPQGGTEAADLVALGSLLVATLSGQLDASAKRTFPAETPAALVTVVEQVAAGAFASARDLFAALKDLDLHLRARRVSRVIAPPPRLELEEEPPVPVFDSSDSLGFLESLESILSDDRGRRDVARVFSWAAPALLFALCCALMLFS